MRTIAEVNRRSSTRRTASQRCRSIKRRLQWSKCLRKQATGFSTDKHVVSSPSARAREVTSANPFAFVCVPRLRGMSISGLKPDLHPAHTGKAVVLRTIRSAKDECICATPGNRANFFRWMRAKSSVSSATTFNR